MKTIEQTTSDLYQAAIDPLNDALVAFADSTDSHEQVLTKYISLLEGEVEAMRSALRLVTTLDALTEAVAK